MQKLYSCLVVIVLLSLSAPHLTQAQNVEAIPDVPPVTRTIQAEPDVRGVSANADATMPSGESVLLPSLSGIVVEEIATPAGGAVGNTISVLSIDAIPKGAVPSALATFLEAPLTLNQIANIRIALADAWDKEHAEIVRVAVPPQDITDGVLTLHIVRAHLGETKTEGVRFFDGAEYTNAMRNQSGTPLDMELLIGDIDWLERNPYRSVGAVLEAGDSFGETDVLLNVQEKKPWQVFSGYDREGSELLGADRLFFGGNHGNVFGAGHRATYQYFTDVEFKNSHGHFASYLVPLPWRHEVMVSGFYSDSSISFPSGVNTPGLETLTNTGESWQGSLDYIVPLPRWIRAEHELVFGFDAKSSDSNLEFGELLAFGSRTETYHFRGEWRGQRYDRYGATSARFKVVASPGDWSPQNSDVAFAASRAGSNSSYVYGGADFDREHRLPGGFSLHTSAAFHVASTNQLASEQLVLSGDGAVRGFERSRIRADRGLVLNVQLNAPAIATVKIANTPLIVKPFTFFDYATGNSVTRLPGEPDDVHLGSVGLGFNTELGANLSGRVAYGWQTGESGFDDGENGRLHLGITTKW